MGALVAIGFVLACAYFFQAGKSKGIKLGRASSVSPLEHKYELIKAQALGSIQGLVYAEQPIYAFYSLLNALAEMRDKGFFTRVWSDGEGNGLSQETKDDFFIRKEQLDIINLFVSHARKRITEDPAFGTEMKKDLSEILGRPASDEEALFYVTDFMLAQTYKTKTQAMKEIYSLKKEFEEDD